MKKKDVLTPKQASAATERARDLIVTAGAGSGKTRTLVARYLSLLEEGIPPSRIAAITFTNKAAREMRNRVRSQLRKQLEEATNPSDRRRWAELETGIDAARIGTIHSLCSEILRAHSAEAAFDPGFSVLEEGITATLKNKAVEDGLNWAVGQTQMHPLFDYFRTNTLQELGKFFLGRRLDASAFLNGQYPGKEALRAALADFLAMPAVEDNLASLRSMADSGSLAADAGDNLAEQVLNLLRCYDQAYLDLSKGDVAPAAIQLFTARRQYMRKNIGKKQSEAKGAVSELCDLYDLGPNNWLGGKNNRDELPDPALEQRVQQINPLLGEFFKQVLAYYQVSLGERRGLDFDDLEAGALRLLEMPSIAKYWQGELTAILVDEFQDTNQRQRHIIQALCGGVPGKLFVVGDARQSIYRFRGADVTIFRQMNTEIVQKGGESIDLDLTYRAHADLLNATGDLLKPVMGDTTDPQRPYLVPFSELKAQRAVPSDGIAPPYLEFILGVGENADSGRTATARAFAARLLELQQQGQVRSWDDVTLLFRSSTGFGDYESAFEAFGIPFLTVAGSGFFDRPEIRDLLNILRALADPWDDLAIAGVLRSPAFGLSDAAIYNMRWQEGQFKPLRRSIKGDLELLDEPDRQRAQRADRILSTLEPWVERLPLAELLQRVIEETDYQAVLATAPSRLWRNLDKLLSDARKSGLVQVRAFMEYLEALRDVGAREGEAPAEAEGAVRLMTIHKAKGLEFNIVALADASRQPPRSSSAAYLLPETGFTYKPDKLESIPLAYRLAQWYEKDQDDAERKRQLYVALTRAKEKLLISGHITLKDGVCRANGWLDELCLATGIDLDMAMERAGEWQSIPLSKGQEAGLRVSNGEEGAASHPHEAPREWPESKEAPLYQPIITTLLEIPPEEQDLLPQEEVDYTRDLSKEWRVTVAGHNPPAKVVGSMVHRAIQRWCFPGDKQFEALMHKEALKAGLAVSEQRKKALAEAKKLLTRFKAHDLWQEINQATERYHELPYTRLGDKDALIDETGYIDVLYRNVEGYTLIEFKTDTIINSRMRDEMVERYLPQLQRYTTAVKQLIGIEAKGLLCFLDDRGQVTTEEGQTLKD